VGTNCHHNFRHIVNDDVYRITIRSPKFTSSSSTSNVSHQSNSTENMIAVAQQLTTAPRDVLPFATALVGFAGGVLTAMYRTGTSSEAVDYDPKG
jgi:hypothetical protein